MQFLNAICTMGLLLVEIHTCSVYKPTNISILVMYSIFNGSMVIAYSVFWDHFLDFIIPNNPIFHKIYIWTHLPATQSLRSCSLYVTSLQGLHFTDPWYENIKVRSSCSVAIQRPTVGRSVTFTRNSESPSEHVCWAIEAKSCASTT